MWSPWYLYKYETDDLKTHVDENTLKIGSAEHKKCLLEQYNLEVKKYVGMGIPKKLLFVY